MHHVAHEQAGHSIDVSQEVLAFLKRERERLGASSTSEALHLLLERDYRVSASSGLIATWFSAPIDFGFRGIRRSRGWFMRRSKLTLEAIFMGLVLVYALPTAWAPVLFGGAAIMAGSIIALLFVAFAEVLRARTRGDIAVALYRTTMRALSIIPIAIGVGWLFGHDLGDNDLKAKLVLSALGIELVGSAILLLTFAEAMHQLSRLYRTRRRHSIAAVHSARTRASSASRSADAAST